MFRHVLCVYPYRRELKKFQFCPPLGLELIATVIEPHTQDLDVVDLRHNSTRTTHFLRSETDMVCFSVNWKLELDFVHAEIRSVPPDIFTVLGGRHVTEEPGVWLAEFPNVDVVIRGDGEEVMEDLCHGVPLESIAGLSFRRKNQTFHNPVRRLGEVKDHHYPNRKHRRNTYEIQIDNFRTGVKVDTVSASRGCPFNCAFCSFNRNPWGEKRSWSGRSPESIVDELAQIDAPLVGFTDDLFTHDLDRVERICDLILARNIRKKYMINARLEIARRPELLRKMEQAGFALLLVGIESAHDKTLRSMRKGFTTREIREYLEVLRDRPMILHGYFILGNIGESVEEMRQIVPFAHELGVDTIMLSLLRHNPFSGLDDLVAHNPNYRIAADGRIYSNHCSVKELKELRRKLYREFYDKRQMLRIVNKAHRSGILRLFSRPLCDALQFFHALRRVWVGMHQR